MDCAGESVIRYWILTTTEWKKQGYGSGMIVCLIYYAPLLALVLGLAGSRTWRLKILVQHFFVIDWLFTGRNSEPEYIHARYQVLVRIRSREVLSAASLRGVVGKMHAMHQTHHRVQNRTVLDDRNSNVFFQDICMLSTWVRKNAKVLSTFFIYLFLFLFYFFFFNAWFYCCFLVDASGHQLVFFPCTNNNNNK